MIRRRIPTMIFALAVALAASACGASKSEIRRAKRSGYQADFSIVFNAVVAAVRKRYPRMKENASRGKVWTAWHSLWVTKDGTTDRTTSRQTQDRTNNDPNAFNQTTQARKRYYVRFDVHVIGGNPWRVRVDGYAQEWRAGDMPVDLKGADEPHWLKGRVNALYVDIYRRLEKHAVLMKEEVQAPPKKQLDTSAFAALPKKAGLALAQVLDAARTRDHDRLRTMMTNDFKWSLGAPGDAAQAMAMWKADTSILPTLIKVIEQGCRADPDGKRVTYPPSFTEQPGYLGYRLGLVPSGDAWKMSFFITGD